MSWLEDIRNYKLIQSKPTGLTKSTMQDWANPGNVLPNPVAPSAPTQPSVLSFSVSDLLIETNN